MRVDLHWKTSEDGRSMHLLAGNNPADLAWLKKRSKFWSAVIWLPEIQAPKEYGKLEDQISDVEGVVQRWFASALSTATGEE